MGGLGLLVLAVTALTALSGLYEPIFYKVRYGTGPVIYPGIEENRWKELKPRGFLGSLLATRRVAYYTESGFQAWDWTKIQGSETAYTLWSSDGCVAEQWNNRTTISAPPWLWGKADQASPSTPAWVHDDSLFDSSTPAQSR